MSILSPTDVKLANDMDIRVKQDCWEPIWHSLILTNILSYN